MGKLGDEGFEQEEVGGESRSLEVLYFAVAGQGSETREEGEKRAPQGGLPATTMAAAEPGPKFARKEARCS